MFAACLAVAILGTAEAEDRRNEGIDAYLLIDRSATMAANEGEVADWLCAQVVDGRLQTGDRVTLWAFSDTPEKIAELTISTPDSKEDLKKAIRSVGGDDRAADFSKAIRAVAAVEAARSDRTPIAYVLIASALFRAEGRSNSEDAETTELFRFSRIEDHPGWKAVTLGLGLERRARNSAIAFMESEKIGRLK